MRKLRHNSFFFYKIKFSYLLCYSGSAVPFHLHSSILPKHVFCFVSLTKPCVMSATLLGNCLFVTVLQCFLLYSVVFFQDFTCGGCKTTSFIHVCVQITCIQNRIIYRFLIPCMFTESLYLLNRLRKGLLVRKPAGMR